MSKRFTSCPNLVTLALPEVEFFLIVVIILLDTILHLYRILFQAGVDQSNDITVFSIAKIIKM